MKSIFFAGLILASQYAYSQANNTSNGNITIKGDCAVVAIGSTNVKVSDSCGKSQREIFAFKTFEEKINKLIKEEKIHGEKLDAVIIGINMWFPILSTQIAQVQSNIEKTINDAINQLQINIKETKSPNEITASFLSSADKKLSGVPLGKCGCHPMLSRYDLDDIMKTYSQKYPNQICSAGFEVAEACINSEQDICSTPTHQVSYRPWHRICG